MDLRNSNNEANDLLKKYSGALEQMQTKVKELASEIYLYSVSKKGSTSRVGSSLSNQENQVHTHQMPQYHLLKHDSTFRQQFDREVAQVTSGGMSIEDSVSYRGLLSDLTSP